MLFIFLLIGFVFLVKGADMFVDGSSSIAKYFKIPTVIIGLTIVALGTSAPEIAVSVTAGLKGNGDIAVSNIIGSNVFNLLVVVGSCGVLSPFSIDKKLLNGYYSVFIISTIALFMRMINYTICRL